MAQGRESKRRRWPNANEKKSEHSLHVEAPIAAHKLTLSQLYRSWMRRGRRWVHFHAGTGWIFSIAESCHHSPSSVPSIHDIRFKLVILHNAGEQRSSSSWRKAKLNELNFYFLVESVINLLFKSEVDGGGGGRATGGKNAWNCSFSSSSVVLYRIESRMCTTTMTGKLHQAQRVGYLTVCGARKKKPINKDINFFSLHRRRNGKAI